MEYLYDFLFADLVGLYTHWTYMHICHHIFLSNYWWQKSDIWSQASYRYPISWETFLDPSDSLNVYKNQQNRQTGSRNLMGQKTLPTIWGTYMKLVTKYQISAINSCWEKCPVCRLSWSLYTLNIYAHFSSHFSQQLLMAEIWYLVTGFI
jgi:hypothetical protein